MKLRSLAHVTAGMALFALASFAQITGVEGYVKGADGKPVQGAIVKLDRTDIKGHYETKGTDKKGHYIYNGLPIGTYNMTVWVDGKQVDALNGVKTSPGDPQRLDFDLKAQKAESDSKQALAQKAMETGQISDELARSLTPEQKAQLQKQIDGQVAQRKKNSALNEAYNNGMTALQNKQYDQAIEQFNKAGELDPNQLAVWSHLAEAYMDLANSKTGADRDAALQKGLETYQKAIALKPDDASLHNNYGLALAKAGKIPEMQAELQKAVEIDPTHACQSYYNLGAILTNSGKTDDALAAFKKATDADPKCADAYYQEGVTLVAKATTTPDGKINPVPGTVEAIQKYLELQPEGKYAADAKNLLATLGSTVETSYKNPDATVKKKKK
jgi:tetratricopeptide (TPR) repeat protein